MESTVEQIFDIINDKLDLDIYFDEDFLNSGQHGSILKIDEDLVLKIELCDEFDIYKEITHKKIDGVVYYHQHSNIYIPKKLRKKVLIGDKHFDITDNKPFLSCLIMDRVYRIEQARESILEAINSVNMCLFNDDINYTIKKNINISENSKKILKKVSITNNLNPYIAMLSKSDILEEIDSDISILKDINDIYQNLLKNDIIWKDIHINQFGYKKDSDKLLAFDIIDLDF